MNTRTQSYLHSVVVLAGDLIVIFKGPSLFFFFIFDHRTTIIVSLFKSYLGPLRLLRSSKQVMCLWRRKCFAKLFPPTPFPSAVELLLFYPIIFSTIIILNVFGYLCQIRNNQKKNICIRIPTNKHRVR